MNEKFIKPKLALYRELAKTGAWDGYPVCTFKHINLHTGEEYIFEGHIIHEVIEGDYKRYKILTYDGKYWLKHKLMDEVKIIKNGSMNYG